MSSEGYQRSGKKNRRRPPWRWAGVDKENVKVCEYYAISNADTKLEMWKCESYLEEKTKRRIGRPTDKGMNGCDKDFKAILNLNGNWLSLRDPLPALRTTAAGGGGACSSITLSPFASRVVLYFILLRNVRVFYIICYRRGSHVCQEDLRDDTHCAGWWWKCQVKAGKSIR